MYTNDIQIKCTKNKVFSKLLNVCCISFVYVHCTVETYDKKSRFSVRESGFFLFPAGYIRSFGRGIRFSGKNCSIPASRGRKSRVSISYRKISYRMSPPYFVVFLCLDRPTQHKADFKKPVPSSSEQHTQARSSLSQHFIRWPSCGLAASLGGLH